MLGLGNDIIINGSADYKNIFWTCVNIQVFKTLLFWYH